MDLLLYGRYRREGGKDSLWKWEFGDGIKDWDEASAPGQLGQKVERFLLRRPPPDSWARSTTNLVHWATGVGWGIQFGLIVSKASRRRWIAGLSLGPAAWLSSYVLLPLAKVYKPIWDYDRRTLEKDLSAHILYGVANGYHLLCGNPSRVWAHGIRDRLGGRVGLWHRLVSTDL